MEMAWVFPKIPQRQSDGIVRPLDEGLPSAQYSLGKCCENGWGLPQHHAEARNGISKRPNKGTPALSIVLEIATLLE